MDLSLFEWPRTPHREPFSKNNSPFLLISPLSLELPLGLLRIWLQGCRFQGVGFRTPFVFSLDFVGAGAVNSKGENGRWSRGSYKFCAKMCLDTGKRQEREFECRQGI